MSTASKVLAVYTRAEERYRNGTATVEDEVLLELWHEMMEQAAKIREQDMRISLLNSMEFYLKP